MAAPIPPPNHFAYFQAGQMGQIPKIYPWEYSTHFDEFMEENNIRNELSAGLAWMGSSILKEAFPDSFASGIDVPQGGELELGCRIVGDRPQGYAAADYETIWGQAAVPAGADGAGAQAAVPDIHYWLGTGVEPEELVNDLNVATFKQVMGTRSASRRFLINLVAAHQVSPISGRNIENYFKSKGAEVVGDIYLKLIDFAASVIPEVKPNPHMRGLLENTDWMKYHTAVASTANLAEQMIAAFPAISDALLTDDERRSVRHAVAAPWDKTLANNIPLKVRVMTRAYLEAFDALPSKRWFQGDKAFDAAGKSMYRLYVAGYKRAGNVLLNMDALNAAATMAEVIEIMRGEH